MTAPKPDCWASELASSFQLDAVARSYRFRPPYAPSLVTALAALAVDEPRTVLDLGCGIGDLARHLAGLVDRVDAVDASRAMIEQGRTLEHGDRPNLRWIHARAEDAPLRPPYSLVVAGDSLHWMDWPVVVPRVRDVLSPSGSLGIAGRQWGTGAPEERDIWVRYGRIRTWRPLDLVQELESRGLFEQRGASSFTADWAPTVDEYLAASRSRASYPTEPEEARAFDHEMRALLARQLRREGGERLHVTVTGRAAWGVPRLPQQRVGVRADMRRVGTTALAPVLGPSRRPGTWPPGDPAAFRGAPGRTAGA